MGAGVRGAAWTPSPCSRTTTASVEKLFKRFEDAGDRAFVEKRKVVDRIIEELSVHAAIEEQLFYPVTRATVPAVEDVALESLEEHHIVKWVLSELEGMDPEDERFDAKVTVLIENVRHHVEEEESEYFPEVRDELGRKALGELGDAMAAAKETAPTRPHPRSPDTPPGNIVGRGGGRRGRQGRQRRERTRPGWGRRRAGPGRPDPRAAVPTALTHRVEPHPAHRRCRPRRVRRGRRPGRRGGAGRRVRRRGHRE